MITYLEPSRLFDLPVRVPSPFAMPPHPLAVQAVEHLRRTIPELGVPLDGPGAGKMFGVLVVAASDGRIGYLRAFSGMLGGSWHVPGFAPPVFDELARAAFWPAGEAELAERDRELAAVEARAAPVRAELAALDDRHRRVLDALRTRHLEHRRDRHARRAAGDASPELDRQSQTEGAQRKRTVAHHRAERAPVAARLRELEAEIGRLEQRKAARSRELLIRIHDTYAIADATGHRRTLRELFAPAEPPGGAGDCAAPKLLALAYAERLRPIAFAEVWCGAPPATGGRHDGALYPACRGKCGPILAHALEGLATDPLPVFGVPTVAADEPRIVFEDDRLAIVDKPVGLLSVPGRGEQLRDSVVVRLRQRFPFATGPLLVHRLDLDTSGLLLVAKDSATHTALQAQFARRAIDKRYNAWLDGVVVGDAGTIELALRVDLEDRPRQIYDPVHGRTAITEWRVVERTTSRTRVALFPRTGRSHQLRVHCAHPRGLDAPIVGDRLYARAPHDEPRMLLHAEAISFVHPHTGERIDIERPAPF